MGPDDDPVATAAAEELVEVAALEEMTVEDLTADDD
jgi:hypothetical protein